MARRPANGRANSWAKARQNTRVEASQTAKAGSEAACHKKTDTGHLLTAMARLMLAHEDELNARGQEMELMVFMQSGPKSLIPALTAISKAWHQKADSMMENRLPLRVVMITSFFKELELRSRKVMQTEGEGMLLRSELAKPGLISDDGQHWNQMQWSRESQLIPMEGTKLGLRAQPDPGKDWS